MKLQGIQLTWLGHSTFRVQTPEGKTLYIDPWIAGNPKCPESEKNVKKADALICTHGHGDHIGDAVDVGKKLNPIAVGIFELCLWLQKKGVKQIAPMNKGGTQTVAGVKITMVHAVHSCGIQDGDQIVYGGEACGYVLEFSNGVKLYHAGDTNVFSDMAIIRDLYAPKIAMLPIGDLFTMSPREAAYACKLLQPETVIPMHFGTFPQLTGTPAELQMLFCSRSLPDTRWHQLDQVAITFLVFAQQNEVVIAVRIAFVLVALLRDVHLAADHRMDAVQFGLVVELNSAEKIAVIRHGHGGHFLLLRNLHELRNFTRPIEQGVIGMAMKMNERVRHTSLLSAHNDRLRRLCIHGRGRISV